MKDGRLLVDAARCIGCGACVGACPFGALEMQGKLAAVNDACALCGACVPHCPYGALTLHRAEKTGTTHPDAWRGVWVVAELLGGEPHPVVFELIGQGRALADKRKERLTVVVPGYNTGDVCQELLAYPVDGVLQVESPALEVYEAGRFAAAVAGLVRERMPAIVLAGATAAGREYIPRVAARCRTGLTADCTELDISAGGHLLQTRPAFGGNIMARILCRHHRPQMATVRPKVFRPCAVWSVGGVVEKVEIPASSLPSGVRRVRFEPDLDTDVALADADVVVCGGAGMGTAGNFALLHELAQLLGGAVGATREAVDRGWQPYAHQVGQTGRTVAPEWYIACGVSGAVQHVAGMRGAGQVVAINRDPAAPIFQEATYGIVGDVMEILPVWIRRLREGVASGLPERGVRP